MKNINFLDQKTTKNEPIYLPQTKNDQKNKKKGVKRSNLDQKNTYGQKKYTKKKNIDQKNIFFYTTVASTTEI